MGIEDVMLGFPKNMVPNPRLKFEVNTVQGNSDGPEKVIPVHNFFVIVGVVNAVVICSYTILLPTTFPDTQSDGKMLYISEGFKKYCGWSIVVLGLCSTITLLGQCIAGIHCEKKMLVFSLIFLEFVGWYFVLGIQDTGWEVHYVFLVFFFVGNTGFHYIVSRDPTFGNKMYQLMNYISVFFIALFIFLNRFSELYWNINDYKNFAVCVEYVISIILSTQQIFLLRSLDQFQSIELRFVPKRKNFDLGQSIY
jgi:hypothetical protein